MVARVDKIDPKLLNLLVCPKTRTPLRHDEATNTLVSKDAKLVYPIREGVPILLMEEATPLD